jgi:hypothetical protein
MIDVTIAPADPLTEEYSAAEQLEHIFERDLAGTEGRVLIIPNLYLWGQKIRQLDLVVIGQFAQGARLRVRCKADAGGQLEPLADRNVYLNNFCWVIEVKDHDIATFQAGSAFVHYREREHDVTQQSDGQMQSLRNYLKEQINLQPFICNLIWFRNMDRRLFPPAPHNYVGSHATLDRFAETAFASQPPRRRISQAGKPYYQSACISEYDAQAFSDFDRLRKIFAEARAASGILTRSKVELITKTLIGDNQQYVKSIGERLVVIRGRAGTGKTVKLLRLASDLVTQRGERCLILTYNKTLVSDIQRLMALAMLPDELAGPAVQVRTVHSFMRSLLIGFGVYDEMLAECGKVLEAELQAAQLSDEEVHQRRIEFEERFFLDYYDALKGRLLDYLRAELINAGDIAQLMKTQRDDLAWDHLLIDESQDWPDDERDILFAIFPSQRFIIADGVDQFVRGSHGTRWTDGVEYHKPIISEKRSLRQKTSLCAFVGHFAQANNVPWDVEPSEALTGGRVIITPQMYSPELHTRLYAACVAAGNKAYEMLFLAPPMLVDPQRRRFALQDEWARWQPAVRIWDGISPDLRSEYPQRVDEHRVLQYDSCRGLEGWTVVCLDFDDFVQYKHNTAPAQLPIEAQKTLPLRDEAEERALHAARWSLIPLTRAIDTLVITLRDPQSATARQLREIAAKMPDAVEWLS